MRAVPDVVQLFLELAGIPSPPGGERAVADRVLDYVAALGLVAREDDAARETGGTSGNLGVRLDATELDGTPLVFCAHLDTVPVDGPIEPVVEDGVVRNASRQAILGADNKAAVAVLLEASRRLVAERRSHAGVELVFTTMEEVGCVGAKALDGRFVAARTGFVYDHEAPIGTVVAAAPYGYRIGSRFTGRSAHAGIAPELGRSAIRAAASAVAAIPHGRVDHETTLNVGLIDGGTAANVVPECCDVVVDVRSLDGPRARALVDEVVATFAAAASRGDCTVTSSVHEKYRGYRFGEDEPVVHLASRALAGAGFPAIFVAGGGGSDAHVFNERGIRCLNLANGMSRIHTAEEEIAVEDLHSMVDVTLSLIEAARVGTRARAPT